MKIVYVAGAILVAGATIVGSRKSLFGIAELLRKLLKSNVQGGGGYFDDLPIFKLKNNTGMEVHITPIGAAITKMIVPHKGKKADVVLGYDSAEQYARGDPCTYFGVCVGRVANRIAEGKFKLGDNEYSLLVNNGPNSLHGGALGLHKRVWDAREVSGETSTGVELTYTSPPGEEGYPGELHVSVSYILSKAKNELLVVIRANADERTPVNIAQHSYFNLGGHAAGTILDHVLTLPKADHYTPVDAVQIPTGQILPVTSTPFDFTEPHAIGERIGEVEGGYDHNYVLFGMGPQARFIVKNGMASEKPKLAATLKDPKSGRTMDVLTTAPGVQFYSGNFLSSGVQGAKGGAQYQKHSGLCLETQGFPNAINTPAFPSVILEPDSTYRHEIVYRFSN